MLSIGLSLISVGINSFGGGNSAKDFGSMENLLLALFVLVVILIFKHWTTGFLSSSAILIGILAGYVAAFVMGLVLPTTGVTADGVEFTKAWVLNWNKVAQASWFAIPKLMPVKIVFDMRAILPVLIMFIVTAVETVGDISGVMEGGMNREPPIRNCPAASSAMASALPLPHCSACCPIPPSARTWVWWP